MCVQARRGHETPLIAPAGSANADGIEALVAVVTSGADCGLVVVTRHKPRSRAARLMGVAAGRARRPALGMLALTGLQPSQAAGRVGGSWPTARRPDIVSGAHDVMPADELETSTLHAYPEVVRTGYEMADHMASNRTGRPTLGVEQGTESGIAGCLSLAFATERQTR